MCFLLAYASRLRLFNGNHGHEFVALHNKRAHKKRRSSLVLRKTPHVLRIDE